MLTPGEGEIAVARLRGRSIITRSIARSPLQLLCPRVRDVPWVLTTHFGGGLVDGDEIRLRAQLDDGAALYLGSQAAQKAYRGHSRLTTEATIGDDALFAMVADPMMLFAGSGVDQETRVTLAPRGSLLWCDMLVSGRAARGERWHFSRFENRLQVARRDGTPLVDEALRLASDDGDIAPRMGRFAAIATIIALGPRLREWARACQPRVRTTGDRLASFAALGDERWIVRAAATSPEALQHALREWLALATLLGEDPLARRY